MGDFMPSLVGVILIMRSSIRFKRLSSMCMYSVRAGAALGFGMKAHGVLDLRHCSQPPSSPEHRTFFFRQAMQASGSLLRSLPALVLMLVHGGSPVLRPLRGLSRAGAREPRGARSKSSDRSSSKRSEGRRPEGLPASEPPILDLLCGLVPPPGPKNEGPRDGPNVHRSRSGKDTGEKAKGGGGLCCDAGPCPCGNELMSGLTK